MQDIWGSYMPALTLEWQPKATRTPPTTGEETRSVRSLGFALFRDLFGAVSKMDRFIRHL
jgi:hypothetical protein